MPGSLSCMQSLFRYQAGLGLNAVTVQVSESPAIHSPQEMDLLIYACIDYPDSGAVSLVQKWF